MKKRIVIWVVIIAVIGAIIGLSASAKNKNKYAAVKTAKVTKGDVKSYLSTTAVIKSKNSKEYYATQIKIKQVAIKVGDNVKKGQVLVSYDVNDLNNAVKQAEIQYNNAVLQRQDLINQRDQINSKISDLDTQINNLQNSKNPQDQAQLATAKQQRAALQPIANEKIGQMDNSVNLAKISLDSSKSKLSDNQAGIVAGFDGVVTAVNAIEGSIGNAMQAAVVVQDMNNLKAVVSLGKYDSEKIKLGQDSIIKSGDKEYKGKVSFIDPSAKTNVSATGSQSSLTAEVDITDKAEGLKIDFDSDIDILLGEATNVLKIPSESIKTDKEGKNFVYIIDGDKALEKEIKVGIQSDLDVEVVSGLNEGQKVILNPSSSIRNGSLVKETVEGTK